MSFSEIPNDKYDIKAVKMSNDAPIPNVYDPLPKFYNFFLLLIGVPGSGKSTFWINMINKKNKHTLYKKFDKVFIFSNSFKTISEEIKLPKDRIYEGISELEDVVESLNDSDDKILLIIDDCINDINDDKFMTSLIYNRRHKAGGISIIITTQVYNKLPLSLRKCATDLVLYNTSSKRELDSIYEDYINNIKSKILVEKTKAF
jgi:hypothetical protein